LKDEFFLYLRRIVTLDEFIDDLTAEDQAARLSADE
jgi:hypothetical protein